MPKPSVTPPTSGQGSIQRGGWLAEADVLAWGRELVGHLWHSVFIWREQYLSWLEYFIVKVTFHSSSSDSGTDAIKPIFNSH